MLRAENHCTGKRQITRFRLEGKLKGDWVRELERCWIHVRDSRPEMPLLVELSDVSFVDESGRSLLSRMVSQGAKLEAHNNLLSASVVDEIVRSVALREGNVLKPDSVSLVRWTGCGQFKMWIPRSTHQPSRLRSPGPD